MATAVIMTILVVMATIIAMIVTTTVGVMIATTVGLFFATVRLNMVTATTLLS